MQVQQAVFTSARTQSRHGYQVVAASPGVDDHLLRELARCGPSHGSLQSEASDADSLNYQCLDREWVACSRSIYGAPEYSGRGSLQVVTRFVLLQRQQLRGFFSHPLYFIETLMLMGHLRLTGQVDHELPALEVPSRVPGFVVADEPTAIESKWIQKSIEALKQYRIAWAEFPRPNELLKKMLACLPEQGRADFTFATGLHISLQRPFHLHVVPLLDRRLERRLTAQRIHPIQSTAP